MSISDKIGWTTGLFYPNKVVKIISISTTHNIKSCLHVSVIIMQKDNIMLTDNVLFGVFLHCGMVLLDVNTSSITDYSGCGGCLRSKHASECQACESEARVCFLWDSAGM